MDNSTFAPPSVEAPTGVQQVSHRSLSAGAIAGIVIGVVALVFVLFLLFISCFFRKKREIVVNLTPQVHHQIGSHDISIGIPTSTVNKRQQINTNQHSGNPKNSSLMEERFKILTPYEDQKQTKSTQRLLSPNSSPPPPATPPMGSSKITFSYRELAVATNRFSDVNLLGQGGFGYVHRGVLPDGRPVAVKQMKADSGQGESEFEAEVEIISRVHHRYLVSLVGYCIHEEKRLLVYEFVPNKTLDFHLHGKGKPTMAWSTRLKVALGSSKGLAYLHEDCIPKIIHRDVKAANILVDFNFEVKVADFGLAKLTADVDQTHISTRVMGTFGYLAPEYASTGKLSDKSDVYSYGVMLLELITGHRPILAMGESLVDWARPLLTEALENNNYEPLIDPRLDGNYDIDEVERLVACAAACIRHSAKKRPKMGQVVRVLEGGVSLEELNAGVTPGHSTIYSASGNSNIYDSAKYREDLKRFRMMALETGEEASSSDYTSSTNTSKQYTSSGFFSGEAPH